MSEKIRNEFASYGLERLKRLVLLVLYSQPFDWSGEERQSLAQDVIRK